MIDNYVKKCYYDFAVKNGSSCYAFPEFLKKMQNR